MASERKSSERKGEETGWNVAGRPRVRRSFQNSKVHRHNHFSRPNAGLPGNHRGSSRLPWRRGPREFPLRHGGLQYGGYYTLFIDNLPHSFHPKKLLGIFEKEGKIEDIYISKKKRANKDGGFGFVRFCNRKDAENAIKNLHGWTIAGQKIAVSWARYKKGGDKIHHVHVPNLRKTVREKFITKPAYRDQRRYNEVVMGKKQRAPSTEQVANVTPVSFTLNVDAYAEMGDMLKRAIIVENSEVINLPLTVSKLAESGVVVTGKFYLSPTKMLLAFANDSDVSEALDEHSVLWEIFDDVRVWMEGELLGERLVWLEIFGIHPKCYSLDNVKAIGEKWGPVLIVDHVKDDVECLTYAKVLVRTYAQNKVDARVRLLFENGACEVWVKECGLCGCKDKASVGPLNRKCYCEDSMEKIGTSRIIQVSESPLEGGVNEQIVCSSGHSPLQTYKQQLNVNHGHDWTFSILQNGAGGIDLTQQVKENSMGIQDSELGEHIRMDYGQQLDPLILELRPMAVHDGTPEHFDPMASLEALIKPSIKYTQRVGGMEGTTNKKPRGRPKRQKDPAGTSCIDTVGLDEAHKTWNAATVLGISSNNTEAVICNLRKSKRLLLSEVEGE